MKKIIIFLLLSIIYLQAFSLDTYPAVSTTLDNGRYEIIQSPIARKFTFRLDKVTGDVWQLVKDRDDRNSWQKVPVENSLFTKKNEDEVFIYQIFMGGIMVRDCFLIDTSTGTTWVLVKDREDNVSFELFY